MSRKLGVLAERVAANLELGKKIAVVLGGLILLLLGVSGTSMWAIRTEQKLAETVVKCMMKARLAATLAGDTSAIAQNMGKMIMAKGTTDQGVSNILELRKNRTRPWGNSRRRPTSNDKVMTWLAISDLDSAVKDYGVATGGADSLHAKAEEATNWQENRVAAEQRIRNQKSRTIWLVLIGGCLIWPAAGVFAGIALTRSIATPVATVLTHLNQIGQGDLSKDAPGSLQSRGDEIGDLARGTQSMTESLRKMIGDISAGIGVLSSSSTTLIATSTEMTHGSRQASGKAHSVSAAAEQMSTNIASVAAGMEQTTSNLAHVSSATEHMTSMIGEIAQDSEKARRITKNATDQTLQVTEKINQLGRAAREIGKVTETIAQISSQTNLLALNATIEAARAGVAGKGFAVVATEIKALAQQTAAATEDIKTRIGGVQTATAMGIAEIGKVSQVISEVNAIVISIAAAIEEQSSATKEIAQNIGQASGGLNDANRHVSETSHSSREIAKDIVIVDRATAEMANYSVQVRSSADELSVVAESLQATVSRFHA